MARTLFAVVMAAGLLAAFPAAAKPDLDCLWDQLTPDQQASRIPPEPNGDMGPPLNDLTRDQVDAMRTRCGLVEATSANWLTAVDLLGDERGLIGWLGHNAGLSPARLESAWNALSETERAALARASRQGIEGGRDADATAQGDRVANEFADRLGLPRSSQANAVAATFVTVRSLRLALVEMTPQ